MTAQNRALDEGAQRSARHDLVAGLVLMSLGAFMFYASFDIPLDPDELGIGPRFFPQAICVFITLIGIALSVQSLLHHVAPGDISKFTLANFKMAPLPLFLINAAYVWMFSAFGYITSTLLALFVCCYLFGVRGKQLMLAPPILTLVFYYVFFGLMGVFEPPADIFNVVEFFKSL